MPEPGEPTLPAKDVVRHLTHELRQPLSALESIAYYLQMTLGGSQTDVGAQVERLQQMVDSANWVLSDVLHLLQMAPPHPVPVDLAELHEEVLSEAWVSEGLAVQQSFAEELPAVWVDLEQCRHLLRSVFQFMRRSIDEPQNIRLSGDCRDRNVRIEFRASAPHVCPESLFEALGGNQLLTCRHIAENNAGRFSAEKDKDGWLCLRLDLPMAAAV